MLCSAHVCRALTARHMQLTCHPTAACRTMLSYASGAVTKNAAEKKINSLLDFMSSSQETELLQRFYVATLESDEGRSNERLYFKAKLKLCDLWFKTEQFGPLGPALAELQRARPASLLDRPSSMFCNDALAIALVQIMVHLPTAAYVPQLQHPMRCDRLCVSLRITCRHRADMIAPRVQRCTGADGAPDLKKATLLLEVYALELQTCAAQRNFRRLKELYDRSLAIRSAIPHPRVMGVIRESGGKMHMRDKAWAAAHTDFFEAFKSYDDAGSPRRCGAASCKHFVRAHGTMSMQLCCSPACTTCATGIVPIAMPCSDI
jgi:hypothetical protein